MSELSFVVTFYQSLIPAAEMIRNYSGVHSTTFLIPADQGCFKSRAV